MFITVAIIIQALFWVALGFLLSLFFIKKEEEVPTRTLSYYELADRMVDQKADQKILDVATEFYNDVNR